MLVHAQHPEGRVGEIDSHTRAGTCRAETIGSNLFFSRGMSPIAQSGAQTSGKGDDVLQYNAGLSLMHCPEVSLKEFHE